MSEGTIIGWHLGDIGPTLAAALPGWRYVAAPSPTAAMPRPPGRVVLVGYSAGCQGVRASLLGAIPSPDAVVTIDGTHGSWPPAAWQLEVWRKLGERALGGGCLWVTTTLGSHRYTERLPGGKAFASTGAILERALGYPEGKLRLSQTIDSRGLHLRSYPSKDMDAPAHAAQVREVLPELWRDVVVPWLGGAADTDPAPPPSSATGAQDASGLSDDPTPFPDGEDAPAWRLGLRALAWLGVQAVQGVREVPGLASDPRILAYSRECRRGGTFLGVRSSASEHVAIWTPDARPLPLSRDEDPWCAALASAALFMALVTGEAPPHGLRVSVRELCEDGRGTGALRLVGSGYEPQPGDLAIMGRAGADPLRGGTGHVHRVVQVDGPRYLAIGGNEGNEIRVDWHPRARVLAWIAYP